MSASKKSCLQVDYESYKLTVFFLYANLFHIENIKHIQKNLLFMKKLYIVKGSKAKKKILQSL